MLAGGEIIGNLGGGSGLVSGEGSRAMATESLRLAIEIAEAADRAVESKSFNAAAEARRIVADHPQALVPEEEIAEVLQEEAERQVPGVGGPEQKT